MQYNRLIAEVIGHSSIHNRNFKNDKNILAESQKLENLLVNAKNQKIGFIIAGMINLDNHTICDVSLKSNSNSKFFISVGIIFLLQ